jgi:hypothetical protein
MRYRRITIAIAGLLGLAALAPAQASAAAAAAAKAHPWLQLPDAFFVDRQAVTVPHRAVAITGGEWPYVADQTVMLRVFLGSRVIKTRQLRLHPSGRSNFAEFHAVIVSPGTGTLAISVTHAATSALGAFKVSRDLASLDPHAGFGSRGRFVHLIQQRLAALHVYIPQTGVYDQGTGLALDAYHRLLRRGTSQQLDGATINDLLGGVGSFKIRYPRHGRHAEGDLTSQLLALVNGSKVDAIYPISSGKASTPTILGNFHIYSRVPGYLPDGMYYSNFFVRGYAIHGYDPAPDYPASHGCMRLPIVDAISVYNWLALGDWVDVYY